MQRRTANMIYFKQEDFDKCVEWLTDKPETVETQQELYKFMHDECHMIPYLAQITVKNLRVYSRVYATRYTPKTANWCVTMSDGSQVVWNRKYQEFYWIDEVGIDRCNCVNYLSMFPEMKDIDAWLLENWSNWRFKEIQKQLLAIWNGKFNMLFKKYWW